MDSISASYSGEPKFTTWPRDHLPWLMVFVVFFSHTGQICKRKKKFPCECHYTLWCMSSDSFISRPHLLAAFLLVLLFKYPINWRFLRNLSVRCIFRCWKNCVCLFRFQDVLILESTLWLVQTVAVVWVVNGMARSLCALGWTRRMIMHVGILCIKCCNICFITWKMSV